MEETKLLRILIMICLLNNSAFAQEQLPKKLSEQLQEQELQVDGVKPEDLQWAGDIAKERRVIALNQLQEMMNLLGFDHKLKEEALKPRPALQIFVSSSMGVELLKSYALEAKRYGGVLVFRGLPEGSIRKLINLVMVIAKEDSAEMQIDDEAFAAFGVTSVPAIVLSKPAPILSGKTTTDKFDKITGSIKIKVALETFISSGDMAISKG